MQAFWAIPPCAGSNPAAPASLMETGKLLKIFKKLCVCLSVALAKAPGRGPCRANMIRDVQFRKSDLFRVKQVQR